MRSRDKLVSLCFKISTLIDSNVTYYSSSFQCWYIECKRLLVNYFGKDSIEVENFLNIEFTSPFSDEKSKQNKCKHGLEIAQGIFESIISDMYWDESDAKEEIKDFSNDKVFIVHGHDSALKYEVARLVEKQGIEAIILHEQNNLGKTIIEKIEHYGNTVGAAIILFTPDDEGKAKSENDTKGRARQNVIFEAGYFLGYLGRDRVIPLVSDKNIELPSDMLGVVYTNDMWRIKIINELKAIGFKVDMNKIEI